VLFPRPARSALRVGRRARLFAVLTISLAVLLPIRLVTHRLSPRSASWIGVLFFRSLLAGLRIRVRLEGLIADDALVVANHISFTDILALGASRPMAFVAKSEVRGWPLLGMLARLNATIFIERGAPRTIDRQVEALATALAKGPVALFPEGTTGNGAQVLQFRPALFAAAEGRRVQPVAIAYRPRGRDWEPGELAAFAWDGDKAFWPHLLAIADGPPIDCLLTVLPTMTAGPKDRKANATDCREAIVATLSAPRAIRN
jgi:1-acyl-sn-glycerol-3-phosphate acyltransferase